MVPTCLPQINPMQLLLRRKKRKSQTRSRTSTLAQKGRQGAYRGNPRQVALREEHAVSEPDGVEWHRPYDARRQANMAISTAVVAVDNIKTVDMWSPSEKDVYCHLSF